jgi:hypothetical protein
MVAWWGCGSMMAWLWGHSGMVVVWWYGSMVVGARHAVPPQIDCAITHCAATVAATLCPYIVPTLCPHIVSPAHCAPTIAPPSLLG